MGSRSSRRRSAAPAAAERALLSSLLRHGALFPTPDAEVLEAAQKLVGLGVVDLQQLRTVRCAHAPDGDFPPPTPTCDGLIHLRPDADEGGGQYRCPRCERIVYPAADRKEVFESLVVHHRQAGIEAFLIDRCGELALDRAFAGGVLALSVQGINAALCLVDYCHDERWLRRGFGVNLRCVYVTAGPDLGPRILRDGAIAHVELIDVVLGTKDLRTILVEHAAELPALLANVDFPVYSLGARLVAPQLQEPSTPPRIFRIAISPAGVLVNGLLAVRTGRFTAIGIMHVLIERFAQALVSTDRLEAISAADLADAVQEKTGGRQDPDTMRRRISGMREEIAAAIRCHTGEPVGEHDIIETVSRSGAEDGGEGYRLNPATVALMHFES
jgi:hypothetical protein